MPKFDVTEEEWLAAEEYLQKSKHIKLYRSDKEKNLSIIRRQYNQDIPYATHHSFIRVGRFILALNPKPLTKSDSSIKTEIGRGGYGKVKLAQQRNGKVLAVKCQHSKMSSDSIDNARDVFWINYDLNLAYCYAYRNDHKGDGKAYTVMRNLGQSFSDYLEDNEATLPDRERLILAAKMCFQLYKLHNGWASKTGRCWYHGDIKPSNFTIDKFLRVRLVDFDMVEDLSKDRIYDHAGTHLYLPYYPEDYSRKELDHFALLRTLSFPTKRAVIYRNATKSTQKARPTSLITEALIQKYSWEEYIGTGYVDRNAVVGYNSPLTIARRLALTAVNRQNLIANGLSTQQIYTIMVLLHADKLSEENIDTILSDDTRCQSLSKLAPIADLFPPQVLALALENTAFLEKFIRMAQFPQLYRYQYVELFLEHAEENDYDTQEMLDFDDLPTKDEVISKFDLALKEVDPRTGIDELKLFGYCVLYGLEKQLKQCITLKCDPNIPNLWGQTPLMDALWLNNAKILEALLDYDKVDPSVTNIDGYSAASFSKSSSFYNQTAVNKRLQQLKNRNYVYKKLEAAKISANPKQTLDENSALGWACYYGLRIYSETILNMGADVNALDKEGFTPLMDALKKENADCIELILSNPNIDLLITNTKGQRALDIIRKKNTDNPVRNKFEAIISIITDYQQAQRSNKDTIPGALDMAQILYQCIEANNIHYFKKSIEDGADINVQTLEGETPMMLAIKLNRLEHIQVLLQNRALSLLKKNSRGKDILWYLKQNKLPEELDRQVKQHLQCELATQKFIANKNKSAVFTFWSPSACSRDEAPQEQPFDYERTISC